MDDARVTLLREGMSVEDADGDSVGTVKAVYRPVRVAPAGTGPSAPASGVLAPAAASTPAPAGDTYLKVHSGLPLLGKTLYIPSSAIRDVSGDRVILEIDETRVNEQGWQDRPSWIDD
jgi:hypothetical protein